MFGEPEAFQVFKYGEPVSGIMTQRRAYDWVRRQADESTAIAALGNKHEAYAIRQSLDERDSEALAKRQLMREMLDEHNNGFSPASGDVVIYPDGTRHRISHVWRDDDDKPKRIQTSRGGSWHWSTSGHMSFSGSLYGPIPAETLTWDVAEYAEVSAWFFHHEWACAHNSVNVKARVRVWRTTADVPSSCLNLQTQERNNILITP